MTAFVKLQKLVDELNSSYKRKGNLSSSFMKLITYVT